VAVVGCHGDEATRQGLDEVRLDADVEQLEAIRETLANVDDAAAAKAAAPRLAALRLRLKTIRAEMGELSSAAQRTASVRYGEVIASLTRAIAEESRRIAADPVLAREFGGSQQATPPLSPPS